MTNMTVPTPSPFFADFYPPSASSSDEQRLEYLDRHLADCGDERIRLILRISSNTTMTSTTSSENADCSLGAAAPLPPPSAQLLDRKSSTLIAQEMTAQLFMVAAKKKSLETADEEISVVRPVFETVRFDAHDSFGRALLGPFYRESVSLYAGMLGVWMIGLVVGWLALWHFIPINYVWFGLLMFPHIIYDILLCNRPLFSLICRQQHAIVYFLWCGVNLVAMMLEFKTQENYVAVAFVIICSGVSCSFVPLFDAFPSEIRAIVTKVGAPACVPFLMTIQAGLFYNWPKNPPFVINALGHLSFSASSIASSAINNVVILTALNAWYAFRFPSSLVMVRSRTESFHLSVEEVAVLRAMDAVSKKTAAEHKEEDILTTIAKRVTRSLKLFTAGKARVQAATSSKVSASELG